jgi:hypothetical protein
MFLRCIDDKLLDNYLMQSDLSVDDKSKRYDDYSDDGDPCSDKDTSWIYE